MPLQQWRQRQAKKQSERARWLGWLPDTRDALEDGAISAEHADIIGRAARTGRLGSCADTEGRLLGFAADATPEQLRAEVRRAEQEADEDTGLVDDEALAHSRRRADTWSGDGGLWGLHAELAPVDGAVVDAALQAFSTADGSDTPRGLRRSPRQKRADALVDVARAALASGDAPTAGGIRPHLSVLVDYDTLMAKAGGVAETGSGTVISGEAARRLACDAGLRRIITKGASQVLDVGRATPRWPAPLRAAIVARDRGCRWPGCDRPAGWCVIHHVDFYSHGGPTSVDNGVTLCWHHHRRVHEEHWTLEFDPDTGRVEVTSPSGSICRHTDPPATDRTTRAAGNTGNQAGRTGPDRGPDDADRTAVGQANTDPPDTGPTATVPAAPGGHLPGLAPAGADPPDPDPD